MTTGTKCPHCQQEVGAVVTAPIVEAYVEVKRRHRWWPFGERRPVVIMRQLGGILECIGCSGVSAMIDDRGRVIPRRFERHEEKPERPGRRQIDNGYDLDADLRRPVRVR